jgi:hypothetical protein
MARMPTLSLPSMPTISKLPTFSCIHGPGVGIFKIMSGICPPGWPHGALMTPSDTLTLLHSGRLHIAQGRGGVRGCSGKRNGNTTGMVILAMGRSHALECGLPVWCTSDTP